MNKLKIEYLPLEDLKPYANNAKIHTEEQIQQIRKSIEEFGMNDPIAIWKDNEIIEGHGRLLACRKLGLQEVPVIRLDDLTDEQRRAYMNVHNQLTMNTGFDLDLLAAELNEINEIDMSLFGFDMSSFEEPEDVVEDDYDIDAPVEPKAKLGDIYQLGQHRLMCGDSTSADDFEKLMQGEKGRMCVTSPPYGVGMEYEEKGIEPWRKTIFGVIDVVTKHVRIICWNIGDLFGTGTQFIEPTSMYSTERMDQNGFGLMYSRIWKKQGANFNGVNPYHLVSMKPVQEYEWILGYGKRDYENDYKPIQEYMAQQAEKAQLNNDILATITGAKFMYGHWFTFHQFAMMDEDNYKKIQQYCKQNKIDAFQDDYSIIRRKYDDLNIYQKTLTDDERRDWGQWAIWDIATVNKREGHPAAFPVELPSRCIKMHSREGDIVVEPFGGSGTTMIACEQLGRQCRMMELDPHYCDVIIDRWEKFTGEKAVLLED